MDLHTPKYKSKPPNPILLGVGHTHSRVHTEASASLDRAAQQLNASGSHQQQHMSQDLNPKSPPSSTAPPAAQLQLMSQLKCGSTSVYAMAFTRNGEHIAACVGAESPIRERKAVVVVYNWKEGKKVSGELGGNGNALCVATSSFDEHHVAVGFDDHTARVFNYTNGEVENEVKGHSAPILAIAFHPSTAHILCTSSEDCTTRVWNLSAVGPCRKPCIAVFRRPSHATCLSFSPRASNLVIVSLRNNSARVYDFRSQRELTVLQGHDSVVDAVSFSPTDEHIVATCGWDKKLKVWNWKEKKVVAELDHTCDVTTLSFSPHQPNLIATGSGDQCTVWDYAQGKTVAVIKVGQIRSVSFHPQSPGVIAIGGDEAQGASLRVFRLTASPPNLARVPSTSTLPLPTSTLSNTTNNNNNAVPPPAKDAFHVPSNNSPSTSSTPQRAPSQSNFMTASARPSNTNSFRVPAAPVPAAVSQRELLPPATAGGLHPSPQPLPGGPPTSSMPPGPPNPSSNGLGSPNHGHHRPSSSGLQQPPPPVQQNAFSLPSPSAAAAAPSHHPAAPPPLTVPFGTAPVSSMTPPRAPLPPLSHTPHGPNQLPPLTNTPNHKRVPSWAQTPTKLGAQQTSSQEQLQYGFASPSPKQGNVPLPQSSMASPGAGMMQSPAGQGAMPSPGMSPGMKSLHVKHSGGLTFNSPWDQPQ